MARAHNVYVIQEILAPNGAPLAAFTVKYEAQGFLERRAKAAPIRQPVFVYRLRDGGREPEKVCVFTEKEFMDK